MNWVKSHTDKKVILNTCANHDICIPAFLLEVLKHP